MNLISLVKDESLFERVTLEGIPFYKWNTWIEQTLNKEVLSNLFGEKGTHKKKADKPATKSMFKLDLMNFMKKFTSKKSPEKVVPEPKRIKKTKKKKAKSDLNEP
jgi:hypothetical protein